MSYVLKKGQQYCSRQGEWTDNVEEAFAFEEVISAEMAQTLIALLFGEATVIEPTSTDPYVVKMGNKYGGANPGKWVDSRNDAYRFGDLDHAQLGIEYLTQNGVPTETTPIPVRLADDIEQAVAAE